MLLLCLLSQRPNESKLVAREGLRAAGGGTGLQSATVAKRRAARGRGARTTTTTTTPMSHSEVRAGAGREAALALFTGSLYGGVHTITGHPLDTIKSRMQMDASLAGRSALQVAQAMWRQEGLRAFFRGCVPPLWGSMVYRGLMMSGYEFTFTYIDKEFGPESAMKQELLPSLLPIRPIVVVSSVFAASCRGLLESPVEYAKVMGQIKQQWVWRDMYRGVQWQMLRTVALLVPIFSTMDYARRKTTFMATLAGSFAVTAAASGAAYLLCWPLETMKNLAQTGIPHPGASVRERLAYLGGPAGVYRGVWPGCSAGAIRNGCGMVAMVYAQKWATRLGLRE